MGRIHFIRSGGIGGVGKSLFASMLIEYIRLHKIPYRSVDVGGDFFTSDENRAYSLIDLADQYEVIVDLPSHLENESNHWIGDIAAQIEDGSTLVADWFIHNMTLPSWQAHQRQVVFWQKLKAEIPQLFLMNAHGPIIRGCLPPDVQKICWDNQVALAIFPVLKDVPLDERPIGEIIDQSCYPYRKSLYEWQARLFRLFKATLLFQELPPPDISGAKTVRDLLAIVKAGFPSNKAKQEEIEDCPF